MTARHRGRIPCRNGPALRHSAPASCHNGTSARSPFRVAFASAAYATAPQTHKQPGALPWKRNWKRLKSISAFRSMQWNAYRPSGGQITFRPPARKDAYATGNASRANRQPLHSQQDGFARTLSYLCRKRRSRRFGNSDAYTTGTERIDAGP